MADTYNTKSLFLASYLYSVKEVEFVGSGQANGGNVYFTFKPGDKVSELVDGYYTGKATCNARDLAEGYKTLKDLIFEVKENQG